MMQDIPNLLQIRQSIKTLCEVDSTIIKSMSAINDKLDIHTDTLVGFGAGQTIGNIGDWIQTAILIAIFVLILIKKR